MEGTEERKQVSKIPLRSGYVSLAYVPPHVQRVIGHSMLALYQRQELGPLAPGSNERLLAQFPFCLRSSFFVIL